MFDSLLPLVEQRLHSLKRLVLIIAFDICNQVEEGSGSAIQAAKPRQMCTSTDDSSTSGWIEYSNVSV